MDTRDSMQALSTLGLRRCPWMRVRGCQQSLKRLGVLERLDRGKWHLSPKAREKLSPAPRKQVLIAFSTDLGVALWGNAEDVFGRLEDEITLALTSPPYPLAKQRAYGNVDQQAYVDWLCRMLEPVVARLRRGGNLALNLSNDIFEPGSPARSLYLERLTLALHDRLGLSLMDRYVWSNPSKPPGPVQWASLRRIHNNVGWEPVLWFSNDPLNAIADNRRVLLAHGERHQRLVAAGGEKRVAAFSGGAYRLREGSFGKETPGRLARNVLMIGHRDLDQEPAREFARQNGLPEHPAPMPLRLAEFFVNFLSEEGDLVVDLFGGYAATAKAAEQAGRRWLIVERCREYIAAAAERFKACPGYSVA